MADRLLRFKRGESVVHRYGTHGELLQEALVTKVYKTGNFKVDKSDNQFRQSGWQSSGDGTLGQEWVEPLTPELDKKVSRHKLELRVTVAANLLVQNLSSIESHQLQYLATYIENATRKVIGETK